MVSSFTGKNGVYWKKDHIWRNALHDDLNTLYERKQLINLPKGGAEIMSSPSLPPFVIPTELKMIPINKWRDDDLIWLNM